MVNETRMGKAEAAGEEQARERRGGPRSSARLAAVQALYQMEMTGADLNAVIEEFFVHRFPNETAQDTYGGADKAYFASLVRGVVERQREIDPLINGLLAESWRLARLDSILRAILRAGALELLSHRGVPAPIVIDEWINVAHAFFSGDEPKVVNGIIDKLARRIRADEMVPAPVREG